MQYFIVKKDISSPKEEDLILIGESSFDNFYAEMGFELLLKMINDTNKKAISEIKIVTDTGTTLSIDDFITALTKLKVVT